MDAQNDLIYENIGWETPLVNSEDYILREIGGEMILVPVLAEGPLANTMMTMNETSVWLWRRFAKGSTAKQVLDDAVLQFDDGTQDHREIAYGIYRYVVESLSLGVLLPEDPALKVPVVSREFFEEAQRKRMEEEGAEGGTQ